MSQIITSRFRPGVIAASAALAAAASITVSLLLPWPRRLALAFRYDFILIFAAVFLAAFFVFRLPPRWRWPASLCAVFFLFGIPLAGLWVSGANEPNTVFGLFPWFDARGYYNEASRLLDSWQFSEISARRPLFPAFFSALLSLTGRNLMVSLAITAALNALGAWTFACEVRRRWGAAAGAVSLTLVFFFYRRFTGSILTETLGLPLALFGFAVLLRAIETMKSSRLFLAVFLLTLALNARAGAFFTLPTLVLWACWRGWRGAGWKRALQYGASALGGVAAGFLINYLVYLVLAQPGTQPFSNFSYTFYGLAAGGKGWSQVFSDHPEVNALLENQRAGLVYSLAFDEIRKDPGRFFSGIFGTIKAFLMPSASGVFGFAGRLYDWADKLEEIVIRLILMLLSLAAILAGFLRKKQPYSALFLFLSIGVLASVPFAPPWDADHMRAYAASIPLITALPAAGLGMILAIKRKPAEPSVKSDSLEILPVISGLLLTFVAAVLPVILYLLSSRPALPQASCPAGQDQAGVRLNPGSLVRILPDDRLAKTHLPDLRQNDLAANLVGFPESRSAAAFRRLDAPAAIYVTTNLVNGEEIWLLFDGIPQGAAGEVQVLCGQFDSSSSLRGLFRVAGQAD